MVNFILYENNSYIKEIYKGIIFKFLGGAKDYFKIVDLDKSFDKLNVINKLDGHKIYILNFEVAKMIRNSGDWVSPIIVVISNDEYKKISYDNKLLMINFIFESDYYIKEVEAAIKTCYMIVTRNNCLNFCINNELRHIPYNDILYIEKNINGNDATIVTKNNSYLIRKTISSLEKELAHDIRFFKSHRGCIVNLYNIVNIDFKNDIIYFGNKRSALLSRNKKKFLKEKMLKNDIFT